jgi:transposase
MVHAGCWAHARRYFFQAVQLNRRDLLALGIVAEIDKLFELEAEAKAAGLGAAERLGLRRKKAEPIVEGLKGELNRPELRRSRAALWAKHAMMPWAAWVS